MPVFGQDDAASSQKGKPMSINAKARAALALLVTALASTGAQAADPAMIAAAKNERQVVWYTTLIVNQVVRPLKAAFERKYPGVELQFARAIRKTGQHRRELVDRFSGERMTVPESTRTG